MNVGIVVDAFLGRWDLVKKDVDNGFWLCIMVGLSWLAILLAGRIKAVAFTLFKNKIEIICVGTCAGYFSCSKKYSTRYSRQF